MSNSFWLEDFSSVSDVSDKVQEKFNKKVSDQKDNPQKNDKKDQNEGKFVFV